jgi:UDP-glucuronate decarboxylase
MANNSITNMQNQKTVLITGGAGFIGSNLCRHILKRNDKVICVDNLYSGKKENIEELLKDENFEFINHDITEPIKISGKIDEIYNLACPASPPHYQKDPVKTLMTNVLGMKNVLDLSLEKKCKVLQASTSEIYGDPLVHPQVESYFGNVNPLSIRACYDEGKRCAETLCVDYNRKYKTQAKIIRIFNTYGPYMSTDDGRVVSNFIIQCLENKDITVYGDGSQTRSFQYVDDLISGMELVMNKEELYGPVNIGNPDEFTVKEFAEKVKKMINSSNNIIFKPLPEADPKKRRPDISLADNMLGWKPKVPLEEGLLKTIQYFKGLQR